MSETLIDQLKAIAHPVRLQILEVLRDGERNVGEIEIAAGIGQPTLSQQLGVLRKAGLVETRKQAKLVYYRLAEESLTGLSDALASLNPETNVAEERRHAPVAGAANFARLS